MPSRAHSPGMFGRPKKEEPEQTAAPTDAALTELQSRTAWRYLMLLDLGFTPDDSLHLVRNPHLDWHEAERLVRRGCPLDIVVRLLED